MTGWSWNGTSSGFRASPPGRATIPRPTSSPGFRSEPTATDSCAATPTFEQFPITKTTTGWSKSPCERAPTYLRRSTPSLRAVADQPYLWANLVMIDSNMTAAIEVRGTEIETSFGTERRSRSNHHVSLGPSPDDDDQLTTVARYESARRRVEDVITLDDVLALQASHDSGPTGICNHLGYHTVYTYVERWHEGTVTLYVGQGQPCETGDPMILDIPLGSAWSAEAEGTFRDAYPSAKSLAIA